MKITSYLSIGLIALAGCSATVKNGASDTSGDAAISTITNDGGPLTLVDLAGSLIISPSGPVLNMQVGQTPPTVAFTASVNGQSVSAEWTVDRGEIGRIDVSQGLFTAAGSLGGSATVTASFSGQSVTTRVTVKLSATQNGDTSGGADGGVGAGGNGGVGGNGVGGPATQPILTVLSQTPSVDASMRFLYPYDGTLWPKGLLPPLLQWDSGGHNFDGISIHLSEGGYDYVGTFAANAADFVNHPIPDQVWATLADSNQGEDVAVSIVLSENGSAFGPLTATWKFAAGPLKGTLYYNSYGTALEQLSRSTWTGMGGEQFGGATLSIKPGAKGPTLTAGANGDDTQCRVCHSVSANGQFLFTQQGDASGSYLNTIEYDLTNGDVQTPLATDGSEQWAAPAPDGSFLFTQSGQLVAVPSGAPIASTGLPSGFASIWPSFSPGGNFISFSYQGAGASGKALGWISFRAPGTFTNLSTIEPPAEGRIVWSSFLPNEKGIVFELETRTSLQGVGDTIGDCAVWNTWSPGSSCLDDGAHGELWWVDLETQTSARLDGANGHGYLPTGTDHLIDDQLNYEPTVNAIVSGGYAWVIFTSRRMYGNVATYKPFYSDPRTYDATTIPTTKKLWVAAINLNAAPGTDPSSPAFYLPGQELMAGNSRGYWAADPCHSDGASCETGDECCGGYCRPGRTDGALICTNTQPSCALEYEKCSADNDCCGAAQGNSCIDGHCSAELPIK